MEIGSLLTRFLSFFCRPRAPSFFGKKERMCSRHNSVFSCETAFWGGANFRKSCSLLQPLLLALEATRFVRLEFGRGDGKVFFVVSRLLVLFAGSCLKLQVCQFGALTFEDKTDFSRCFLLSLSLLSFSFLFCCGYRVNILFTFGVIVISEPCLGCTANPTIELCKRCRRPLASASMSLVVMRDKLEKFINGSGGTSLLINRDGHPHCRQRLSFLFFLSSHTVGKFKTPSVEIQNVPCGIQDASIERREGRNSTAQKKNGEKQRHPEGGGRAAPPTREEEGTDLPPKQRMMDTLIGTGARVAQTENANTTMQSQLKAVLAGRGLRGSNDRKWTRKPSKWRK